MKTCYFIDETVSNFQSILNLANLTTKDEVYFFTKNNIKNLDNDTLIQLKNKKIRLKVVFLNNIKQREDFTSFAIATYISLNTKKQKKFDKYVVVSKNKELIELKANFDLLNITYEVVNL